MTRDQIVLFVILAVAMVTFVQGRWRHDMVALAALLACVTAGLVPPEAAFTGFGHPAVITVACVLVMSRGLQTSGAVDLLAARFLPAHASRTATLGALTSMAALLSCFMNNVGALALTMPVSIQAARRLGLQPGQVLMPVAFTSVLGGIVTLIGTPPNLMISAFRRDATGAGYGMFDFTPVGLAVALAGIAFTALVGWRLVPVRPAGVEGFDVGKYLTEARVPEDAKAVGMSLGEIEAALEPEGGQVLGLVRREVRLRAPRTGVRVLAGDILMLEAQPDGLAKALAALGIKLEAAQKPEPEGAEAESDAAEPAEAPAKPQPRAEESDVDVMELVVPPGAALVGRTAREVDIRARYHINLLAITREGRPSLERLRATRVAEGDVLLVQGSPEAVAHFAADQGCLPLAPRRLDLPDRPRMLKAVGIFAATVTFAATGLVEPALAFAAGVLAVMATRVVPPRAVYQAIDWPVIVLLACLLPVADALETSGAAELVAQALVGAVPGGAPIMVLGVILVLAILLSDVLNNAATVAVMAPIALGAAASLEAPPDTFLMAVAIGASCAFLTPIGHQNNTLILGPGGFRFGDYWQLGLPLEIISVAVGLPLLVLVWGL